MSSALPIHQAAGDLLVIDTDTGEALPLRESSDRALAHAAEQVAALDKQLYEAKRALAAELRDRHGVGTVKAGGYEFKIAEAQSWPLAATEQALGELVRSGAITKAEADRAMPSKPKPDTRQLRSLLGRLVVTDPEAARALSDACTVSPASVRDVHALAVEAEVVEAA